MIKFSSVVAILAALATVQAQVNLPYYLALDPNFVMTWGVDDDSGSIEIQLDVGTRGWLEVALLSEDGTMFDIWWGGFDSDYGVNFGQDAYCSFSNLTVGPRYPDTLQNLELIDITQAPFGDSTRVRFRRTYETIDFKQDVNIPYNTRQIVYWAYSSGDLPSNPAVASGLAQVVLRPATATKK